MWIKIKNRRVNLNNVTDWSVYKVRLTLDYNVTDDEGQQLGIVFDFDTEVEAKLIGEQLDKQLNTITLG